MMRVKGNDMNLTETINAALTLSDLDRKVYSAILEGLYAEPGFSDLEADEVAVAVPCMQDKADESIARLVSLGLVWVEEPATHLDRSPEFVHAEAHDEDFVDEVFIALNGDRDACQLNEQERFIAFVS